MSAKILDGPVNERDSVNAIPTLLVHARLSLINIDSDLRGDLIDLIENDDATAEMMLVPIDNFPEVPLEVVEASGWIDVASGRWCDTETRTSVSWRVELQHAGLKSSRVLNDCFEKGVWRLWTIWLQPSVLKDGDHATSWC